MGNLIQSSFSKGEISPDLQGRVDTAMYKSALATATNCIVKASGGIVNRPGTRYINFAIDPATASRLHRFRFNTTDTYMLEFGNFKMHVIRDNAKVQETAKAVTALVQTTSTQVTINAHGYVPFDMVITNNTFVGPTRLANRTFIVAPVPAPTANTFYILDPVTGQPLNSGIFPAWVSGGTFSRVYTLATPWASADVAKLKFTQSASVLTVNHPLYPERKITRTSDTNWTITTPTFAPATLPPLGIGVVNNSAAGTTITVYEITAIDATTGEESLPSAPFAYNTSNATINNTVSWGPGTNVSIYNVYRAVNGVFGFIGYTNTTAFADINYTPTLSTTPPGARDPFTGVGNYPACSQYFQQRHIRGGSMNNPDTLYMSQTGRFYNMSVSVPSTASDAITAQLVSREVNVIRHLVPMRDLIAMTAGQEWKISAGTTGFSASDLSFNAQGTWGCSHLEPIVVGLTMLWAPENQVSVRYAAYTYLKDAYTGDEATLLSSHMFTPNNQLIDWSFGHFPDPLILGVRSDGSMVCCTWQEEQQMNAWTRWYTNGGVRAVDIVRPNLSATNLDDAAYIVVDRLVAGGVVRLIERLHTRRFTDVRDAFFVDAGLSYDNPVTIARVYVGPHGGNTLIGSVAHGYQNGDTIDITDIIWNAPTDAIGNVTQPDQLNGHRYVVTVVDANNYTVPIDSTGWITYLAGGTSRKVTQTVTGLDHIEAASVIALADGNVITGLTVTDGSVTLPIAASRIHIGMGYNTDVETLDMEAPQGTIQGKAKIIPMVTLRIKDTRGHLVGPSSDQLIESKQRLYENMGDPVALETGDDQVIIPANWSLKCRIFVRQLNPLPLHILDIIPTITVED